MTLVDRAELERILTASPVIVTLDAICPVDRLAKTALYARFGAQIDCPVDQLNKVLPPDRYRWWDTFGSDLRFLDLLDPNPQAVSSLRHLHDTGRWITVESDRARPDQQFRDFLDRCGVAYDAVDVTGNRAATRTPVVTSSPLRASFSAQGILVGANPAGAPSNVQTAASWQGVLGLLGAT